MRHDLTKMQVESVVLNLRDLFEDDEKLKLDTLEGETDLFELLKRLLDRIEDEDGSIAALAEQISDRQTRKERATKRKDAFREAITALMDCAQLDKLTLPEATLSIRLIAPKPVFPNVDLVPDEYCKFERKLDREKLKAVVANDTLPSWATLDNGGVSLTIRRK